MSSLGSDERTVVITGASDGIGAAAARAHAAMGDRVVVVGRNAERTARVAESVGAPHFVADFAELDQVRTLADQLGELDRIDVLANNAGGIMGERRTTVDGHELTWQVNYLAPYLLTRLLLPRLIENRATVLTTGSVAHRLFARLNLDDLELERGYSPNRAYGNAKLADILFAAELSRRFHEHGLAAASFHPGVVRTSFARESTSRLTHLYHSALNRFLRSPEKGAETLIWLSSTRPGIDWPSGRYFTDRRVARTTSAGRDPVLARELWDRTEASLGLSPYRDGWMRA